MVTLNIQTWKRRSHESHSWLPEAHQQVLWEEYQVRTGIKLLVQNLPSLQEPVQFDFVAEDPPVEFMYCLSGKTELSIENSCGHKRLAVTDGGSYSLSYLPGAHGTSKTNAGEPLQAVGLQVHPEVLCQLVSESGNTICPHLYDVIAKRSPCPIFSESPLPLPLRVTVQQILECPLSASMKKVFLEYKTLELIYTQLSLLDISMAHAKRIAGFEHRAAMQAHTLLMEDIASPPSLLELARKVGVTHTRLNKLFRILFGKTVFELLRQERLECARRLLEDGRRSVAEVAYECGFSSPSHLSRAFNGHFGMQPKRYQAEHLKHLMDHDFAEASGQ